MESVDLDKEDEERGIDMDNGAATASGVRLETETR